MYRSNSPISGLRAVRAMKNDCDMCASARKPSMISQAGRSRIEHYDSARFGELIGWTFHLSAKKLVLERHLVFEAAISALLNDQAYARRACAQCASKGPLRISFFFGEVCACRAAEKPGRTS